MRFIHPAALALSLLDLARAQGVICPNTSPQCTPNTDGRAICCAKGQSAINGKCVQGGALLCSDRRTVCSGAKSQCTVNVSVYIDRHGAASNFVCCRPGQKALNGICFDGKAKVMPCYQGNGVPCDWGKGYYCAWNAGNADSKCCRLNEYYNGFSCVKKP